MPENSLMNKTDYKRLGDYIREVDSRNRDLAVTKLVGLTIEKAFIPSVANVIGTDLSNYKVIRREQFACSLMQVSRDGKMPIAMFEEEAAIMSPAYPMFEVVDTGTLLPKYLMMWFSRKEFDREASFYAVGGVRGSLTWEDFCDLRLPIPPLSRQREIVAEYETLTRRIRLNERLISSLESAAQTLYRRTFLDNPNPSWRTGTLGEIAECFDYKRKPLAGHEREAMKRLYPYYGAASLMDYVDDYLFDGCYILMGEDGSVINEDKTPIVQYVCGKFWVNNHAHILKGKNGFDENLLYLVLRNSKIEDIITGGVQAKISQANMFSIPVLIPPKEVLSQIKAQIGPVFAHWLNKKFENEKLREMLPLLLSSMGN